MLTTLRRLDFCDWNCAVTFHERSCLIPYPIDGKVSLRVLLAVDSRLFEGELVKKWSKSRTGAPHPLPQSLCIWYTGLQRLLLVLLVFLSCFSLNLFVLLLFSCLCTGMLRMFFLYFPFFSFFSFLCCFSFCMLFFCYVVLEKTEVR